MKGKISHTGRCASRLAVFWFARAFLLAGIILSAPLAASAANTGKISGTVINKNTGEPVVGATVMLKGTTIGAKCNLDGEFMIKDVPVGNYTVITSSVGYVSTNITEVAVSKGETVSLSVAIEPQVLEGQREVTVTAKRVEGTDAALLKERQMSMVVSDAISAASISRSGSSDAAEAMTKVTGASVVGGKYVYVRGLGDRYTNAMLNGAPLPSADPDKHAFNMDLVSSDLLDKIVVRKTFTPDQPGNFTGGSVDIGTKSMPDRLSAGFSQSEGYNPRVTGNRNFLSYTGGKTDWLAVHDASYDIPAPLRDPNVEIPDIGAAQKSSELAHQLEYYSKSFSNVMAPSKASPPVNQDYDFSFGNRYGVLGRPMGVSLSLTYSRKVNFYDDGRKKRWKLPTTAENTNDLDLEFDLADAKGSDAVHWGGLAGLTYEPGKNHRLNINYMYNRDGESVARYLHGSLPRDFNADRVYEARVLRYTERMLGSLQIGGDHYLGKSLPLRIEWQSAYATNSQDDPDLRYFTDDYQHIVRRNGDGEIILDTTTYAISLSRYPAPSRYFRDAQESNGSGKVDFSLPLRQWSNQTGKIKFGGLYMRTDRRRRERTFKYNESLNKIKYAGDPESFFGPDNSGVIDSVQTSTGYRYVFGNTIYDETDPSANYDADREILGLYGMVELPITSYLQLIGGARYEKTDTYLRTRDVRDTIVDNVDKDWLPAASLVYKVTDNSNIRAAYSQTLARPTFREQAPYATYEFVGDFLLEGNPTLVRTLIENYYLRWEIFPRANEIFAVSGYLKKFRNPIERVIISTNGNVQYQNVDKATVYGAELEIRSTLDRIIPGMRNFMLGGNLALIHSSVRIGQKELEVIRGYNPDAKDTRPLQGQSPYLVNVDFSYVHERMGTSMTLLYSVFGKRLAEVSESGTPDVYEQPFHRIDFIASQRILGGLRLKASFKNTLNSTYRQVHEFKGVEYVESEYRPGRSFSVGFSYTL
jgi:outer membrane receptor protein involved in Fe transport